MKTTHQYIRNISTNYGVKATHLKDYKHYIYKPFSVFCVLWGKHCACSLTLPLVSSITLPGKLCEIIHSPTLPKMLYHNML